MPVNIFPAGVMPSALTVMLVERLLFHSVTSA